MNFQAFMLPFAALLAGCGTTTPHHSDIDPAEFARIEQRIGGRLGVALVDGHGQLLASHRGAERFAMCSTFKAPLASALFAAHADGKIDMHAEFELTRADLVPYAPVVQARLAAETPTSLMEMAQAAIETSDNAAANLVLRSVGGPAGFTEFVRTREDGVTRLDRTEPELNTNILDDPRDTTTPIAMARLLHQLLVVDASTNHDKITLQTWMMNSKTGAARIRAGLPAGWAVGDKTGTAPGGTGYGDTAIIWPATDRSADGSKVAPIILTVYIDRPTQPAEAANAAIADIARTVAQLLASRSKGGYP